MRCSCAHLVGRGCCGGSAHVVGGSAHCEHVQVFDYENPGLVGRDGLPMSKCIPPLARPHTNARC